MSTTLEKRLKPLNQKLSDLIDLINGTSNEYAMRTPEPFQGVIDGFPLRIEGDNSDKLYILWLDRLHSKYDQWSDFLKIQKGSFLFEPPGLHIEGNVRESGCLNNFDYCFVDVKKK